MRLIDVDKIEINEECTFSGKGIKAFLDAIPTAYDVDKVVELLEEMRTKREEQLRTCADNDMADYFRCKMSAIAEVIEIVKSGGIE